MFSDYKSKKIIQYRNADSFIKKIKKKKIILCHGVFDIVHPGHIRHFAHCKQKADILIVSLTRDIFIKKGTYRPMVPERLRAFNLASLQLVDYVIIDQNISPVKLLKKIKPNFFAKGLEYADLKNPLTVKEKNIVESFGGKMIFSPGDYVLSSSKIINQMKPDLKFEKLKLLMDTENIDFNDLKKILKDLSKLKVHILGDTIIDTSHYCEVIGGLHKTPTLSVVKQISEDFLGGAAIVASHFKSFAKNVTLTTLFSNDEKGKFALKNLKKNKIKTNYYSEDDRPTTNKNSYIVNKHKLLKVDELNNNTITNSTLDKIIKSLKKDKNQVLVFSDFRHGIFNNQTLSKIFESINHKTFKVADSQVASRWGNISDFKNFDLLTPTEREARYSLFEQDTPIRNLVGNLQKKSKANNIILKLGEKGLISISRKKNDYIALDPFVDNLIDSNGAGDALLAYSASTLYTTKSLIISSIIGLLAASCKCETQGNLPVTTDQIIEKINLLQKNYE
ncbi:PfkB family carbohydrate kinase [Candidatus Pelagibacter sp.]|jgi:rfaE bifunctional protein kinase chain/domain/rfaE bifunctional protein nucleotidyltransferase chain/domain|nr:PfkB family carbohydrate kinase [Candidatus Pelagibacter sp.]